MASLIKGCDVLSVFIQGKPYTFSVDDEKASLIIEMVREGVSDEDLLSFIVEKDDDIKEYCENMRSEGVEITEDTVLIDGEEISYSLAEQIRRHYNEDLPIEPLVKFVQKVRLNPSYRIRNQLWLFIEASQRSGGFTLAEDGDILAYKKVRADYKDIHSGKFDNSVGQVVEMERKNVDDDPNNTCSSGLHFCAYSYLASYGSSGDDRVMLVKVNPADVVSIPTDYNNAKARCCRYEVVQEIEHIISQPVYSDYDVDDDPTDDWTDEEDKDALFEKYEDNFKDRDKDFLYRFIVDTGYDPKLPEYFTYEDCIDIIKEILYDDADGTMDAWESYCVREEGNFDEDFDEFLSNYTKRELVNFYNFVAQKDYKFQSKTQWQMVEIVKELFDDMPPNKDKNVFINAWLASSKK